MRRKVTVEVIPSARRLIKALRDVGYDFTHAVADIIDNSIAAKASQVKVDMKFDGENSWVRISDNGTGMSGSTITEAMRFGTERDYDPDELGKFGLGLKTASLSQCSRLTVASRISPDSRRIEVRQWDLEYIDSTDRWEIINVSPEDRPEFLFEPLNTTTGTVVLWELLDRVLGYKIPWGDRARTNFFRLAEELDEHLAMVFHRFLSGEARRKKKLRITLNGTNIEPWDPFARNEKTTIKLPGTQFDVTCENGTGLVEYTPYILPSQERFSSLKEFNRCAGPGKWNFQQGFYIYRADRILQSGGWCHMRTSDEHTKLARVALDFWPDLDSAFDVNVPKARVNLPANLKVQLKPHIEELVKQARKAYTPSSNHDSKNVCTSDTKMQNTIAAIISSATQRDFSEALHGNEMKNRTDSELNLINSEDRLGRVLELAAEKAGEIPALNKIRQIVILDNPAAAKQIGW